MQISVPLRGGQVYILFNTNLTYIEQQLPSPLEVDRFISDHDIEVSENPLRYRPLVRFIGYIIEMDLELVFQKKELPSPLEVNRFISSLTTQSRFRYSISFRPLSRYIGLYLVLLEMRLRYEKGFRPLSKLIGLYQVKDYMDKYGLTSFRPLSRLIGLYPHIL